MFLQQCGAPLTAEDLIADGEPKRRLCGGAKRRKRHAFPATFFSLLQTERGLRRVDCIFTVQEVAWVKFACLLPTADARPADFVEFTIDTVRHLAEPVMLGNADVTHDGLVSACLSEAGFAKLGSASVKVGGDCCPVQDVGNRVISLCSGASRIHIDIDLYM